MNHQEIESEDILLLPEGKPVEVSEALAAALKENVTRLEYEGKELILVGTAHVSKDSIELVEHVIETEQPDSVCIELDDARFESIQNPNQWKNTDIVQVIKSKRVGFLLANLVLSSYQKRIAKNLDTEVGGEMLQAIKSGREIDATLVMADRSIQTTFLRIWRSLSFWEKAQLLTSLLFSFSEDDEITEEDLEEMLQQDVLESALSTVHGEFPKIGEILISERDQHLAYKIKNAPGEKIVAVLGAAHIPGVKEEIYKEQDLSTITHVPEKKKKRKYLGWIVPLLIVGLIVYGFVLGVDKGLEGMLTWIVWNSGLAALFTLVTLPHPLTLLVTIVMAPFSAINPLVAVGWFSGLTEAALRKPTVNDLQNMSEDVSSLKGWYKNRFLRILLIVIMANIGGSIGNIVGGVGMFSNLFK